MQGVLASLAALMIAVGSVMGGTGEQPQKPQQTAAVYSNLVDAASQNEVKDVLVAHGAAQEQADTLILWADDFNKRVKKPALPTGFVPMQNSFVDYSGVQFDAKVQPDGMYLSEANCRLTSFLLMRNMITTNGKIDENDTYLMFDVEAIVNEKQFAMSETDRAKFTALFNWVDVSDATTLEQHIKKIEQAWRDRAIKISDQAGLSLIEVYLDAPFDKVRFVGHTGVLAETENGLLFVEKYGPQAPFQATRFANRKELKAYLLARPDLYGDETELAPIIMENGKVME